MLPSAGSVGGCALWPDDLMDLDSFGENGLRVEFGCHCGGETVCVVTEGQYAAWVSDQADAFGAVLEDWGIEGMLEFWLDQEASSPESVLVELVVLGG